MRTSSCFLLSSSQELEQKGCSANKVKKKTKTMAAGRSGKSACPLLTCSTQTHQSQPRPVRAAFIWRSTNGCRVEQTPTWAAGPNTETYWAAHPAHYWIPSSDEQTEASLDSVLFINHIPVPLHISQPPLGPQCLLVVLGLCVPLSSELLTWFPDMSALPFLPEIHWDSFFVVVVA